MPSPRMTAIRQVDIARNPRLTYRLAACFCAGRSTYTFTFRARWASRFTALLGAGNLTFFAIIREQDSESLNLAGYPSRSRWARPRRKTEGSRDRGGEREIR